MLSRLSRKLSCFFVPNVSEEDREVYNYSFEMLLATLLNIVVLCGLAAVTKTFLESLLFVVGFVPLRSLAGGYHAKTHFRCLLTLLLAYAFFWVTVTFAPVNMYLWINLAAGVVAVILVWLLSPVEDRNKPLNDKEKLFFRKRSRIAVLIYAALIIIGTCFFKTRKEFLSLAFGVLSVSVALAAAKIKSMLVEDHRKYITERGSTS